MKDYKQFAEKHGIKIGNRYRIDHLCNDNDRMVVDIDFEKGIATVEKRFGIYDGYKEPEKWQMSLEGIAEYLKPNQAYQWILVDENRKDVKQ
jgi:hypothetical protein